MDEEGIELDIHSDIDWNCFNFLLSNGYSSFCNFKLRKDRDLVLAKKMRPRQVRRSRGTRYRSCALKRFRLIYNGKNCFTLMANCVQPNQVRNYFIYKTQMDPIFESGIFKSARARKFVLSYGV